MRKGKITVTTVALGTILNLTAPPGMLNVITQWFYG